MKNVKIRVITLNNGEIREFTVYNVKHLKRFMLIIRKECQNFDSFTIDYKIKDIVSTLYNNKQYINTNVIVERM